MQILLKSSSALSAHTTREVYVTFSKTLGISVRGNLFLLAKIKKLSNLMGQHLY